MKIDREYQLGLLKKLEDKYPECFIFFLEEQTDEILVKNAWYLDQHGLIECTKGIYASGGAYIASATLTEKGIDFLAADGGLGAILGVVTIKLHQDTLIQLLEAKIHNLSESPDDKKKLLDQLRSLPADAIRRLTMKLLDMGLDKLPDVFQLLQKALLDAIR